MAHYLLKKRIMLQMQQQQQQNINSQNEDIPSVQNKATDDRAKSPFMVMTMLLDSDAITSNEPSVADNPVNAQTKTAELPKSDLTNSVKCNDKNIDKSHAGTILNLTTKSSPSFIDCDQSTEWRHTNNLHAAASSPKETLPDVQQLHQPLHLVNPHTILPGPDFLKQEREKEKLIARILSVVRASMNNSLQNIEFNDTAMLKQCMNILSNPLNGFGNHDLMNFSTIDQSQMGFDAPSTSQSNAKVLNGPDSVPKFGPGMSESNIFSGHLNVAQLAMSTPSASKALRQATKPTEMRMPSLDQFDLPAPCTAVSYSTPAQAPSVASKSYGEGSQHGYKAEFEHKPFPFGGLPVGMPDFQDASAACKPYSTQGPDDVTRAVHCDDGSDHRGRSVIHQAAEMSSDSDTRDWHVMRASKYESLPSGDQPNPHLPISDEQKSPISLSFQIDSDKTRSPSCSGSETSPRTSPVINSSGQECHPFMKFNSSQADSTLNLPTNSVTSSEGHLSSFSQSERYNVPQHFMSNLIGSADRVSTDRELISTQQSTVISSSDLSDNLGAIRRRRLMTDPSLDGYPVTSSGRNKGLGKGNEPKFDCQVCSDVAAGFHCGAYVCEACKKFYLRCLKNDSNLLTCPKSQRCEINKENRSHCQFCRYQKCITLGMYRPGREYDKNLKVNFKAIPCKVCGACSSGFHFGAITCEGCKGFFRRMLKENLHQKFTCSSGNSCDITSASRTFCKACRFNKCTKIGMKLEGTRLGRQSNSIKRNTLMAYQMQEFDGPPAKLPVSAKIKSEPINEDYSRSTEGIKDMDCCIVDDLDDVSLEAIENIEFDPSLLEVSESPMAKDSAQKESRALKADSERMSIRDLHSAPHINLPGQYKTNSLLYRSNGHRDSLQSDQHNIPHSATSSDAARNAESSSLAPNTHLESLNNNWKQFVQPSANHNNPDHKHGSSQSLYTKPVFNHNFMDRQVSQENIPNHIEKKPTGHNLTSKHQLDKAGPSYTNSALATKPSSEITSRPKPAGTEIYSDCERLVDYLVEIYNILDGMKEIPESLKQFKIEVGKPQSIWNYTMQGFVHNSYVMLKFLKAIPGFRCLPQSKQIDLCQETIYPISLLYHSQDFDSKTCQVRFFCYTDEERELLFASFPNFRGMLTHFVQCGSWIAKMKVDRIELALLTVIFVLTATDRAVCDSSFGGYLEDLTLTLMSYCDKKNTSRGGVLLAKMAELKRASFEHHEMANLTIQQNPDISFGQLWQEIFTFK